MEVLLGLSEYFYNFKTDLNYNCMCLHFQQVETLAEKRISIELEETASLPATYENVQVVDNNSNSQGDRQQEQLPNYENVTVESSIPPPPPPQEVTTEDHREEVDTSHCFYSRLGFLSSNKITRS